MTIPAVLPSFAPAQYLALERSADYKSEFIDGEIIAMSGASRNHSLVEGNIIGEMRARLKGRPCEVHTSNLRVRVPDSTLYAYPDATVVCGRPAFEDDVLDTLLNPTLIFEVLSPSTEAIDRGEKFRRYSRIPSLREYVLVSQHAPYVEQFIRQADPSRWLTVLIAGLDATLNLTSVDCVLDLRDVYAQVVFGPLPQASASPPG